MTDTFGTLISENILLLKNFDLFFVDILLLLLYLRQGNVSQDNILALGQSCGYKSGKWMLYVHWKQVDEVWQKLVDSLLAGALRGWGVLYIKASGRSQKGNQRSNVHV